MKKYVKDFDEFISESNDSEEEFYIIILIPESLDSFDFLTENWTHSGIKDYWYRLENPHNGQGYRHIHLAHEKQKSSKNKQVSWNDIIGTRHDKKTFDTSFKGIEIAKRIARNAFGVGNDFLLEALQINSNKVLNETFEIPEEDIDIFYFKLV
ncbi:hypothetical protein D9V86_11285 [Bacteroidetes/Chlorobi group bacterium ChocPot_Mid]|nr:MAG: hypothetical protein D9V86_11285 [Bacteroidetes/Chlorobi group bacterium ChocPot_Mid]